MPHANTITADMRECIQNCLDCHAACVETSMHCLVRGNEHAGPEHQRLLADCAQICIASADFMLRASADHVRTCDVCAELCRNCADDCERMAEGDDIMRRCVDACRRCALTCDRMVREMMVR